MSYVSDLPRPKEWASHVIKDAVLGSIKLEWIGKKNLSLGSDPVLNYAASNDNPFWVGIVNRC